MDICKQTQSFCSVLLHLGSPWEWGLRDGGLLHIYNLFKYIQ
uniref:Uncharacterized protein n=1 Tax=Rhizophora mucronata TaxID=61149 RepID=A0A2P2PJQ5_RHIMU